MQKRTRTLLLVLGAIVLIPLVWFASIGIELCIQAPDVGDCSKVDWHDPAFTPVDLDGNGLIDCASDLELGA